MTNCTRQKDQIEECIVAEHKVRLGGADRKKVEAISGVYASRVRSILSSVEINFPKDDIYGEEAVEFLKEAYARHEADVFYDFILRAGYPLALANAINRHGVKPLEDINPHDGKRSIKWFMAYLVGDVERGFVITFQVKKYVLTNFHKLFPFRSFMSKSMMANFFAMVNEPNFQDPFEEGIIEKERFARLGLNDPNYDKYKANYPKATFEQMGCIQSFGAFAANIVQKIDENDLQSLKAEDIRTEDRLKFVLKLFKHTKNSDVFADILRASFEYNFFDLSWIIESDDLEPDFSNWKNLFLLGLFYKRQNGARYFTLPLEDYFAEKIKVLELIDENGLGQLKFADKLRLLEILETVDSEDLPRFYDFLAKRLKCGMRNLPAGVDKDFFLEEFQMVEYTSQCLREELLDHLPADCLDVPLLSYEDVSDVELRKRLGSMLDRQTDGRFNFILASVDYMKVEDVASDLSRHTCSGDFVSTDLLSAFYKSGQKSVDLDFRNKCRDDYDLKFSDVLALTAIGLDEVTIDLIYQHILTDHFDMSVFAEFVKKYLPLFVKLSVDFLPRVWTINWLDYAEYHASRGFNYEDLRRDRIDDQKIASENLRHIDYEDALLRELGVKHHIEGMAPSCNVDVQLLHRFELFKFYNALGNLAPNLQAMFFDYQPLWASEKAAERLRLIYDEVGNAEVAFELSLTGYFITELKEYIDLLKNRLGLDPRKFTADFAVALSRSIVEDGGQMEVLLSNGLLDQSDMFLIVRLINNIPNWGELVSCSGGSLVNVIEKMLIFVKKIKGQVYDDKKLSELFVQLKIRGFDSLLMATLVQLAAEQKAITVARPIYLDEMIDAKGGVENFLMSEDMLEGDFQVVSSAINKIKQAVHPYFFYEFEKHKIDFLKALVFICDNVEDEVFDDLVTKIIDAFDYCVAPAALMVFLEEALGRKIFLLL